MFCPYEWNIDEVHEMISEIDIYYQGWLKYNNDKEKIMEVRRTLAYDEIERMVETISSLGYQKDDILRLLEKYLAEQK